MSKSSTLPLPPGVRKEIFPMAVKLFREVDQLVRPILRSKTPSKRDREFLIEITRIIATHSTDGIFGDDRNQTIRNHELKMIS